MKLRRVVSCSPTASVEEVFHKFVRTETPVVIRGAAKEWPCRTKWTPKFLCERYGDALVDFYDCEKNVRIERRLAEYFLLEANEQSRWYVSDWDFRKNFPELLPDFNIPDHFSTDWVNEIPTAQRPDLFWIYIGHAGTRGPTHVDNYGSSAWLAVLQGTKRVRFAIPCSGTSKRLASLNLFEEPVDPDIVADLSEATLEPSDVLFVPAGSWHAAMNDTYCLSLTANFIDGANFCRHRAFEMRRWHGRRMLINQLNYLQTLGPSAEKRKLAMHLSFALEGLRAQLLEELDEIKDFEEFLYSCAPRDCAHANPNAPMIGNE